MPLYIAQNGDLVRCYRMTDDSQTLNELLIKHKSGALVMQYKISNIFTKVVTNHYYLNTR